MVGMADASSGDMKASMEPSRERAMWLILISSGIARANCMRVAGVLVCLAAHHVPAATSARASTAESHRRDDLRGADAATRVAALVSLPESALRAKERSRAD